MKFVTFNIRCDFGQDKENNFCFRKPLILKKLQAEQADILCFQEVLPHVAVWLKEVLSEYYVIGCPRSAVLDDEQSTIAFRKDKFNLMKMESYWLSETPYVPGSRYEIQSICPRICTEIVLQDMTTGKVFRVVNTHLDHEGAPARKLALAQILSKQGTDPFFTDVPLIFCGDFNATPDGDEMKIFKDYPEYVNVTEGIGTTYHGYGHSRWAGSIDYIYTKGAVACKGVTKWTDQEGKVYLSDHYPICAELIVE